MKFLFISNITGKKVGTFSMGSILAATELGYEYHMAANFKNSTSDQMKTDEDEYGICLHQIDFERNPLNPKNIKAYKQLVKLVKEEHFDIIHCNTPIGGLTGRFAGKKCGVQEVIYQAHGFHFYKGAPIKNWLIYYPIERWLAHYTDALITINQEDYERAKAFHLRNHGNVYYVPGVGIDSASYEPRDFKRNQKREELGLQDTDIMIISAGDLIERKNYETALKAMAGVGNKTVHYFICGQGPLRERLETLAEKLGVSDQVHFLGFRTDIKELLWSSDIYLFTTYQEGLPRSLSEAMAAGVPCIASRIRGNVDLITDGENGFLCDPKSPDEFAEAISKLVANSALRTQFGNANQSVINSYDLMTVKQAIKTIYENELCSK